MPLPARANRCGGYFADINRVVLSTDRQLPLTVAPLNWDLIEARLKKGMKWLIESKEIYDLKDHEAEVKVITEDEDPGKNSKKDPATLYAKVYYSYAPKTSFSPPLNDDVLAIWVVTSRRMINKKAGVDKVVDQSSRWRLFPLHQDDGKVNRFNFESGPVSDLRVMGCQVLFHNTEFVCTNPVNPFEGKVERRPDHCDGPDFVH